MVPKIARRKVLHPVAYLATAGAGALIVLAIAQGSVVRAENPPLAPFPTDELRALDRDVQARFAVIVRQNFGMSRIVVFRETHGLYKPSTPEETKHVEELRSSGSDVLFYVMGRPSRALQFDEGHVKLVPRRYLLTEPYNPLIKGPGIMTGPMNKLPLPINQSVTLSTAGMSATGMTYNTNAPESIVRQDLPTLTELRDIGDEVYLASQKKITSDAKRTLTKGGWQVWAVPIPASQQKCVDCHRNWELEKDTIQLNHPLGIAMYVSRPVENVTAPGAEVQANAQQQNQQKPGG